MFSLKNVKKAGIVSLVLAGSLYADGGILEKVEQGEGENQEKSAYVEEKNKSGFFLGIEGNLGGATIYGNDYTEIVINSQTDSQFAFDGGLKFGYQHYFNQEALGVKQAFGLNVGLFVGAGTPANQSFDGFVGVLDPSINRNDYISTLDVSYLPIKTGIEINFLWDFFEEEEHTLGLTAGIGYRFGYYKSLKDKDNLTRRGVNDAGEKLKMIGSIKPKDLMTHQIYPQIGLHYYYGNHQFDFNYRFGGILGNMTTKETTNVIGQWNYQSQILESSYFTFGYSYRF